MKAGLVAARELTDVARETALMQENSAKVVITVCKLIIHNRMNMDNWTRHYPSLVHLYLY